MRQQILTFIFFSSLIGAAGNTFAKTEESTPTRYFAECQVIDATTTSADATCEMLVLKSSASSKEQISSIRKKFIDAQRLEVQISNNKEMLKVDTLHPLDENLKITLRISETTRQLKIGSVIKLFVFIY